MAVYSWMTSRKPFVQRHGVPSTGSPFQGKQFAIHFRQLYHWRCYLQTLGWIWQCITIRLSGTLDSLFRSLILTLSCTCFLWDYIYHKTLISWLINGFAFLSVTMSDQKKGTSVLSRVERNLWPSNWLWSGSEDSQKVQNKCQTPPQGHCCPAWRKMKCIRCTRRKWGTTLHFHACTSYIKCGKWTFQMFIYQR